MNPELLADAERILGAIAPTRRQGQVNLLRVGTAALAGKLQAIVKAPTGTGKSYSGLVAAGVTEGRVVITSATNMLLDQYSGSDAPSVCAALTAGGFPADFVVLKGRRNYPCHLQASQHSGDKVERGQLALDVLDGLDDPGTPVEIRTLARWTMTAPRGSDWTAAPVTPTPAALEALTVDSDSCVGKQRCQFAAQCHYFGVREMAEEAKITITNHAVVALDGALGGSLLGDYDSLIIDECHRFEDAVINAFTWELSVGTSSGGELAGTLPKLGRAIGQIIPVDGAETQGELNDLARRFQSVLSRIVADAKGDVPLQNAALGDVEEVDRLLSDLRVTLAGCERVVLGFVESHGGVEAIPNSLFVRVRRIGSTIEKLRGLVAIMGHDEPGVALFANRSTSDTGRSTLNLKAATVNLAQLLRNSTWTRQDGTRRGVLLMSATVPPGYGQRLGLEAEGLAVRSPFDFERNAVVYVADDLVEATFKNRAQWEPHATARAFEIADVALESGGVLVLCSSYAQVRLFRNALAPLLQRHPDATWVVDDEGETTPKAEILGRLQDARKPFGILTRGYFEGLDLPGRLRAVIMAQVCYPVPSDPLNNAMRDLWPSDVFPHPIDSSKAATLLEQGLGRLIRCNTDRGLLAVLDRRVLWGSGAGVLRQALPDGAPVVGAQYGGWALEWLRGAAAVAA